MSMKAVNPATEEVIASYDELTEDEVYAEIDKAYDAFQAWKEKSFPERRDHMLKAASILRDNRTSYAKILTIEMGKPLRQAFSEVEKCAWVCEYYAENAEKILKRENAGTDASESYVQFDPLGVILAVMPWNFPYWQVFRFAAPSLMAGNVGLLKHSSNVPMSALAIEEVFTKAGFPQNVFKTLLVGSSMIERIISHPKVRAATLTGSDGAGRQVASIAGRNLKKTVLELGGSDAFIVLKDADINEAAKTAVASRIINTGQSCIAAKRFIVVKDVIREFESKFISIVNGLKIGDPMDEQNDLGPIAREDLMLELDRQVQESVKMGARLLAGGKRLGMKGFFYPATVLANVTKGMPAYEQETFGPIAAIIQAEDEEEAIRIANDTEFGLGANLWTTDIQRAKRLARSIEAGSIFINGMVHSDPRLPFGGVKNSGYGRELANYGIKEFVNIKTVWIA
ncbi:MAG: NAD-dependent succinate-semialdehyde dehydrogenase [Ignavibacteria bacterium]|nr:NAD-dependent succinate-semialdehyde dehydrogenase [Ignavibacteria bacterium]MCU7501835.1 NAD-dependent succinate-semialdehyde dehydrogenase [Ignavibacteria bacterium]MCU7514819.1 NAD-dependent succinate-semialdehyde dehydrogenase [Ignavibacteria bacterium]